MGKNKGFYQNLERLGMIEKINLTEEELESILKNGDDELPDDVYWEETESDQEPPNDFKWWKPKSRQKAANNQETNTEAKTEQKKARTYWRYPVLPDNEIQIRIAAFDALHLREISANTKTIKKCAVFFTVLVIILLSLNLLHILASLSS